MTKRKKHKKRNQSGNRSPKSDAAPTVQNKRSLSLKWIVTAIGIAGTIVTVIAFLTAHIKQRDRDVQLARSYQTEILHFYSQFQICLHWTLPIGQDADAEIDRIFKYNRDLVKGIDLGAMHREVVINIFTKYDFAKPMENYDGEKGLNPTGFNHVLGNLGRFGHQLEKHLEKYGSSASSDLTSRLDYAQRMAKAETRSIRLDLQMEGSLADKTAEGIADFLMLLRSDLFWLQESYGAAVDPVLFGKVPKIHPTDGSIVIPWEYGKY